MKKARIRECRFCGGRAVVDEGGNAIWPSFNVVCTRCGASTGSRSSAELAIEAWHMSPDEYGRDKRAKRDVDTDLKDFTPLFSECDMKPAARTSGAPEQLLFSFVEE